MQYFLQCYQNVSFERFKKNVDTLSSTYEEFIVFNFQALNF